MESPQESHRTSVILLTAYLPPIQFFAYLIQADIVYIEAFDHYQKQTYRNRCKIYGANGVQTLSVPVLKASGKVHSREIKIDYKEAWQQNHWSAICSAYGKTPFFEFYKDDFEAFYQQRYTFLWEYNLDLVKTFLQVLEIEVKLLTTSTYLENESFDIDARTKIFPKGDPKQLDPYYTAPHYHQIFAPKCGVQTYLSMLDLLMNKGPESYALLLNSLA